MGRGLTERQILANLGTQSFDEIQKEQVPAFLSLLSDMNPEVATKALDITLAIPQIASEITRFLQETLNRGLESNSIATKDCNDADRAIIDGLLKLLERDDSSPEERASIRADLLEYSSRMHDTNTSNQRFIGRVIDVAQNHGPKIVMGVVLGLSALIITKSNKTNN